MYVSVNNKNKEKYFILETRKKQNINISVHKYIYFCANAY